MFSYLSEAIVISPENLGGIYNLVGCTPSIYHENFIDNLLCPLNSWRNYGIEVVLVYVQKSQTIDNRGHNLDLTLHVPSHTQIFFLLEFIERQKAFKCYVGSIIDLFLCNGGHYNLCS